MHKTSIKEPFLDKCYNH